MITKTFKLTIATDTEEQMKKEEEHLSIIYGVEEVDPEETKWIPCSERLPEKNGRYIVTRGLKACNSIWNRVYIVNYSDLMGLKAEKIWWDGNVGKSDYQRVDDVLAWMPLPEPYEAESEEENVKRRSGRIF